MYCDIFVLTDTYSHLLHMHALYADRASSVASQSFNFPQKVLSMTPSLEKLIQCSRIQLMEISMNTRSQHLKGSRSKRWRGDCQHHHVTAIALYGMTLSITAKGAQHTVDSLTYSTANRLCVYFYLSTIQLNYVPISIIIII